MGIEVNMHRTTAIMTKFLNCFVSIDSCKELLTRIGDKRYLKREVNNIVWQLTTINILRNKMTDAIHSLMRGYSQNR